MIDTPQGFQLNEPLTRLLELVVSGNFCHGSHPILTWMASHAVVRHGRLGEQRLDKESAGEKIDGISAAVMMLDRVVRQPKAPDYAVMVIG
jgi:phage terminase large subunit-like protein